MTENITNNVAPNVDLEVLVKQITEPNAAIRFGSSVIHHNTLNGLDLVVNDTYISLFPGFQAAYFASLVGVSEKDQADDKYGWTEDFFSFEDDSGFISRMSKFGYLWLMTNEQSFLKHMGAFSDPEEWLRQSYKKIIPRLNEHVIDVNSPLHQIESVVVNNPCGGYDMVIEDVYASFNPGVKAVYFMSDASYIEGDTWERLWLAIPELVELGVMVFQKSLAGFTWWIYDATIYAEVCERFKVDPTQFKISPKNVF